MTKCNLYTVSFNEMEEIKAELAKKESVYIGEIDGKKIKNRQDYYYYVSIAFKFSTVPTNINAYVDCLSDLTWLNKEEYILIINNYSLFMKRKKRDKKLIIDTFKEYVFYYWDEEVSRVTVGGYPKPFTVYLVD